LHIIIIHGNLLIIDNADWSLSINKSLIVFIIAITYSSLLYILYIIFIFLKDKKYVSDWQDKNMTRRKFPKVSSVDYKFNCKCIQQQSVG